jgi:hypothetical protein
MYTAFTMAHDTWTNKTLHGLYSYTPHKRKTRMKTGRGGNGQETRDQLGSARRGRLAAGQILGQACKSQL